MKIGICHTVYAQVYGFEKGMHLIREQGYECIDYQGLVDTDEPVFRMPDREFEAFLRHRRAVIEGEGLEISQTHGPWRFPVQDSTPEERAERFEKMARAIRATAILGCPYFVIHAIMPWGISDDPEPQKFHDINLEFMGRLTQIAKENNVVICFENMPMRALKMASPEACLKFAGEINSPFFKLCLDTGHCSALGLKPAEAVRKLGKDMLRVMHVHDNDGLNDWHWIPFTGLIDWEDFTKALQEIGFEGTVSLETKPFLKFSGENRKLQERSLFLSALQLAGRI